MRQCHASVSPPPRLPTSGARIAMVRDAEQARDVLARSRKSHARRAAEKARDDGRAAAQRKTTTSAARQRREGNALPERQRQRCSSKQQRGPAQSGQTGRQARGQGGGQTMTRGALTVDNDRGPRDGEEDGHAPRWHGRTVRGSSATSAAGSPGGSKKEWDAPVSRAASSSGRPPTDPADVGSAPASGSTNVFLKYTNTTF